MRRTLSDDTPSLNRNDTLSESEDFLTAVGYVENRNAVGCVPGAQVGDNLRFCCSIESREGFIQKQNHGIGHEGTGQGNTLALTAGDFTDFAVPQSADAKRVEYLHAKVASLAAQQLTQAVLDVLPYGQMREKSEVLKDISDPALGSGKIYASRCIEQGPVADGDATGLGR